MGDIDAMMGLAGGKGGSAPNLKNQALQRAMFDGSGTQQYRKKLKLPDAEKVSAEVRQTMEGLSFRRLFDTPIARFYYLKFMCEVLPAQGAFLLAVSKYRLCEHVGDRKPIASWLLENYVTTIETIFSSLDSDDLVQQYLDPNSAAPGDAKGGSTAPKGGANKSSEKAQRMADARTLHQELTARLEKRGPLLHMFDDMWENASFTSSTSVARCPVRTHASTHAPAH